MTDDYTPDTHYVRAVYSWKHVDGDEVADAEFDRWLAARDAARDESVRTEERERIARNIEANADDARWLTTSGRLGMARAARIAREGA